jgi:hypothetical protein
MNRPKVECYENPGGDPSKIAKVTRLTPRQWALKDRAAALEVLRKEVEAAKENLREREEALFTDCKHEVFIDETGFLYDLRECFLCGASLGAV